MRSRLYHAAIIQSGGGNSGKKSKSKYAGGFTITNGRPNNTKAYNHDYYLKNKEKWDKDKKHEKKKSFFEDIWDQLKDGTLWNTLSGNIDDFFDKLFGRTVVVDSGVPDTKVKDIKVDSDLPKTIDADKNNDKKFEVYEFDFGDPTLQFKTDPKSAHDLYYEKYKDVLNSANDRHKYVYKVMGPNHKYRYFYSYAEYYKFMESVPQKNREYSIAEDMSAVNKLYTNKDNPEDADLYKQNCGFCTMAYDLRRRGYDVQAIPRPGFGVSDTTIANLYETKDHKMASPSYISVRDENKNIVDTKTYTDRLFDAFEAGGDGASGEVHVDWFAGGGHSMAYQVVNGKGYVLDCQTNTVYDREDYYKLVAPDVLRTGYTRLDDKILKTDNSDNHPYMRAAARSKDTTPEENDWTKKKYEYDIVTYDEKLVGTNKYRNNTVNATKGFATKSVRTPGNNTLDTSKRWSFLPDKERIVSYIVEDAPNNNYHSRPIVTGNGWFYYDEEGRERRVASRYRSKGKVKGRQ